MGRKILWASLVLAPLTFAVDLLHAGDVALFVLGVALIALPREGRLDRRSLLLQLGLVVAGVLAFLVPSIPGFDGDPNRHSLAVAGVPVAVVLLALYVGVTSYGLRRHRRLHAAEDAAEPTGWSLPAALAVLAVATGA